MAAIRYAHKLAGHPTPTDNENVKAVVRGVRRAKGTAPANYLLTPIHRETLTWLPGSVDGRSLECERCKSTDVWNPFLGFDFGCCNRLRRKLEHRCFLTFKQVS